VFEKQAGPGCQAGEYFEYQEFKLREQRDYSSAQDYLRQAD